MRTIVAIAAALLAIPPAFSTAVPFIRRPSFPGTDIIAINGTSVVCAPTHGCHGRGCTWARLSWSKNPPHCETVRASVSIPTAAVLSSTSPAFTFAAPSLRRPFRPSPETNATGIIVHNSASSNATSVVCSSAPGDCFGRHCGPGNRFPFRRPLHCETVTASVGAAKPTASANGLIVVGSGEATAAASPFSSSSPVATMTGRSTISPVSFEGYGSPSSGRTLMHHGEGMGKDASGGSLMPTGTSSASTVTAGPTKTLEPRAVAPRNKGPVHDALRNDSARDDKSQAAAPCPYPAQLAGKFACYSENQVHPGSMMPCPERHDGGKKMGSESWGRSIVVKRSFWEWWNASKQMATGDDEEDADE